MCAILNTWDISIRLSSRFGWDGWRAQMVSTLRYWPSRFLWYGCDRGGGGIGNRSEGGGGGPRWRCRDCGCSSSSDGGRLWGGRDALWELCRGGGVGDGAVHVGLSWIGRLIQFGGMDLSIHRHFHLFTPVNCNRGWSHLKNENDIYTVYIYNYMLFYSKWERKVQSITVCLLNLAQWLEALETVGLALSLSSNSKFQQWFV